MDFLERSAGCPRGGKLDRATVGMKTLVFTVDLPVAGSLYRDGHSGMAGPATWLRQPIQAVMHPRWALDVGLLGQPLSFGNIAAYDQRAPLRAQLQTHTPQNSTRGD
jgi:isopentenyl diphosphate isomerase/L-lactate dehydrogenase-like FMN-dependent dehydrogenase